ncbi:mononucleotidyl cyclase [Lactobacillus reuteri]|uniref:adenylate/guanylate cyclase domain-containing protein n=1 Tax=Limosilactobacillus reuteri TaxID=1598 RepID=UPI00146C4D7E|nr:adenylate/guanylate cyclase domain-containing protein [Limosilactobacillus reuteri]NMV51854.1 mononucleotidyl cyclase [Limosilactobacillus reuteri]NMV55322.1 mononucleotidyl cyclase [Limosilactobacillus reuteri]NMV65571.1 mononucleotidyl cyclase [Limosilactobacillus reuteri]WPU43514.1 adenylate/guanylate cyclase domain-containing protein [Limosilactobacillus reuteri]
MENKMGNSTINFKSFDLSTAEDVIKKILTDTNKFDHLDYMPSLDNALSYTNGAYVKNTAFFIDIRNSSKLIKKEGYERRIIARFYRSYISEIIAVLRSHECCREINIVGDCVSAIFVENKDKSGEYKDRSDVIEALESASMFNPLLGIINNLFSKHYKRRIDIKAGVGIATGEALVIQAGEKGSGINKPIFLGDNVNTAAHLCDKANNENYPYFTLTDQNVKDNCKRYIANPDNQTFADFLATQFPTDEGKYFYGGNFWRIPFNDRLKELQNDCNF